MIPNKVSYTGLEIDPREIMEPRKSWSRSIPLSWTRVYFKVPDELFYLDRGTMLDRWLEQHISGRWRVVEYPHRDDLTIHISIFFEDETDAVMFKLQGGETAAFET